MLSILDSSRAFHAVETPDDLLEYFHAEDLMLLSLDDASAAVAATTMNPNDIEMSSSEAVNDGSAADSGVAAVSIAPTVNSSGSSNSNSGSSSGGVILPATMRR